MTEKAKTKQAARKKGEKEDRLDELQKQIDELVEEREKLKGEG